MKLSIEQAEAQAILEYLAARPYAEVANLVPILLNLKAEVELDASKTTEEIFDEE
jgi:hypothetical protein